tara:strand:+ start:118 stop:1122 length:1005 start_codon:yes stop_codon:yes gene_type:complete
VGIIRYYKISFKKDNSIVNLLVTGGCGFIGSNFIKMILESKRSCVSRLVNLDTLSYAGTISNVQDCEGDEKYFFEKVDLCDAAKVEAVFDKHGITHVVHLAAESHVDNSITNPGAFIQSNIIGTYNLLNASRRASIVRLHHVSTDEVYGDLGDTGEFSETTPYNPHNPYSASKASSDFLVKSYFHTYGLPVTLSNCSNNFGPHQHDEKFIPTVIRSILQGKKIPLYGEGRNIRDWIYVKDHCEGIWEVFQNGRLGETYCIGARCEKRNIEIVEEICKILKVEAANSIAYVQDRAGHDYRYAIDNTKITTQLSWSPQTAFTDGIRKTIEWYNEKY